MNLAEQIKADDQRVIEDNERKRQTYYGLLIKQAQGKKIDERELKALARECQRTDSVQCDIDNVKLALEMSDLVSREAEILKAKQQAAEAHHKGYLELEALEQRMRDAGHEVIRLEGARSQLARWRKDWQFSAIANALESLDS